MHTCQQMSYLTADNLAVVHKELERAKDLNPTTWPTDEEVLICVHVFQELINIGDNLHQDMLSAWAVNNYITYSSTARERNLL
jgi:hypothetical protein